jgi:hypothetical protein
MPRKFQLRRYTLAEGALDSFVAKWVDVIPSLRSAYGFSVEGVWVSRAESQFIWLTSYEERELGDFEEAERRYLLSPERKRAWPSPAAQIIDVNAQFVLPIRWD